MTKWEHLSIGLGFKKHQRWRQDFAVEGAEMKRFVILTHFILLALASTGFSITTDAGLTPGDLNYIIE